MDQYSVVLRDWYAWEFDMYFHLNVWIQGPIILNELLGKCKLLFYLLVWRYMCGSVSVGSCVFSDANAGEVLPCHGVYFTIIRNDTH